MLGREGQKQDTISIMKKHMRNYWNRWETNTMNVGWFNSNSRKLMPDVGCCHHLTRLLSCKILAHKTTQWNPWDIHGSLPCPLGHHLLYMKTDLPASVWRDLWIHVQAGICPVPIHLRVSMAMGLLPSSLDGLQWKIPSTKIFGWCGVPRHDETDTSIWIFSNDIRWYKVFPKHWSRRWVRTNMA